MRRKNRRPLKNQIFVCVDCETTGLDTKNDKIIEVAAVKFTTDAILEQVEWLIDPECTIPEESVKIHNITQDMVAGKPKIAEVLPQLMEFIGDEIIVGHSVSFDLDILASSAERAGMIFKSGANRVIDTLRLARHYGEAPSNSLDVLRRHFNIAEEGAHRAMNDVIVNIDVFRYLAKQYADLTEMLETLKKPVKLKIMPLGPHKGRPIKEVPMEFLRWAANKNFDQDLLFTIRSELKRRQQTNDFSSSTNPFQALE